MKLTQTVKKGGCAAKVPALILKEILSGVKFPPKIPGVEVDGDSFDDAAIFKINDEIAIVQTLDFFTPIVDDPRNFGAIAAANALSDVYAMGGIPKTCMAILAAPLAMLEPSILQEVIQGASEVIERSGSSLVGGHSIDDDTLKFGLSVMGIVNPQKVWTNSQSKIGDRLILTKPLGTGTICAGIKKQLLQENDFKQAVMSMRKLNNIQDHLSTEDLNHIHSATDITGFGLMGHSFQMARASVVSLEFKQKDIPVFINAYDCLEKGYLTKAHKSNEDYTKGNIKFSSSIKEVQRLINFDPQTSGGLLLSVGLEAADKIVQQLIKEFPDTRIIGEVRQKSEFDIYVE
jgi:selenide,water dikinase